VDTDDGESVLDTASVISDGPELPQPDPDVIKPQQPFNVLKIHSSAANCSAYLVDGENVTVDAEDPSRCAGIAFRDRFSSRVPAPSAVGEGSRRRRLSEVDKQSRDDISDGTQNVPLDVDDGSEIPLDDVEQDDAPSDDGVLCFEEDVDGNFRKVRRRLNTRDESPVIDLTC
jgi:hypothetical protein